MCPGLILAVSLALELATTFASPAEASCDVSQAMLPLQDGIQIYLETTGRSQDVDKNIGKLLVQTVDRLSEILPHSPQLVPDSYCKALAMLGGALGSPADTSSLYASRAQDVLTDLQLKVAFLASSLALDTPLNVVSVTVVTKQNAVETSGYVISANPLINENPKDPLFVFPKLSSPTTMSLPPGCYYIFAVKAENVACKQQLQAGINRETAVTMECLVQ